VEIKKPKPKGFWVDGSEFEVEFVKEVFFLVSEVLEEKVLIGESINSWNEIDLVNNKIYIE